jgi:hypothetical protein
METTIKEGALQHYSLSLGQPSNWGLRYFTLLNSGVIKMNRGDKKNHPVESNTDLKVVHDFICVGQYTNNVPSKS